jgi:multidrug efflux system membrane fusion protein
MPITVSAIGTVQPVVSATVRPQQAGVLSQLFFTEGEVVRKGQKLAEIDPRPYKLALAQAQANLARDEAQLNAAGVDLKRYKTLLAQDSIASQQVDTQAATVKQLDGTVAADRAALGTARLNLEYTTILAPVAGKVGLRQVDVGNYITPSDANGIVVITQSDPIDVSFALPQQQIGKLQQRAASSGDIPVTALDQSDGSVLAQGKFLTLDNQIDATSGTVKAKARFPNTAGTLFPNQFVNVNMLVDTLKAVPVVPVSAIRHGAPGDFAFVIQPDQTVKLTVVKTGPGDSKRLSILSGLQAGQTVVTEGADTLENGATVKLPDAGGKTTGSEKHPHTQGASDGGNHTRPAQ